MSNFVAIVKSLVGPVFAVSLDGFKRQVFEGERLLQGEQLMTALGGEATLQLANGELVQLRESSAWQAGEAGSAAEQDTADPTLEQALTAGFDPSVDLEAPAAGPAAGGTGGAAGGGHSFVLLDETGLQLDPSIGFPTEGLSFASTASDELPGALDNGSSADTANSGAGNNSGGNGGDSGNTGPANSAPNALADTFSLDEDGSVAIDVLGNDSDLDGDTLSITQVDGQPITDGGSVGVSNGSVTLSGNQLVFTPNANYSGPASFTYTISDGALTSTATVSGTVNPVADLNAADDSASGDEDSVINASVTGNDSTTSGGTLSYSVASNVSNGSLTLNADGSYSYTPNANFNGSDSFTYTVTDAASGESRTQTVSLTINPVADLNAADDSASGDENTVINASVAGNDSTTSGGTLSYSVASNVSNGSLTLNADGSYSYTPNANFNGSDSFTYTVTDAASGESLTQTVSLTVNPVTPPNNAPVTNGTIADQNDNDADSVSLNVSSFFSDVDGDTLSYSASGLPSGLSIDPATGIISGTLDNSVSQGGSSGAYSITVTASDPDGASVDQTFTWNLANPAPTAANDTGSADEGNAVIGNVLDNDSDPDGDDLSVTQFIVAGDPTIYTAGQNASVEGGTLQINSNGSYSFTPAANWNGTLPTVTYSLSDGEGGSDTATLIITVNPVTPLNNAPITNGTIADQNDNDADSVSLNVSSFFSDVDGDTLSYSASGLPSGLSIDPATGIISGTLDNSVSQGGSSGAYSITVTASDPDGASVDQTFTWNLANPAPTAANDTGSADEGNAVIGNVLDNDSDPDGDDLSVTQFVVAGDPTIYTAGQNASVQGGTLQINGNGSYSFTPAANWNGTLPTVAYSLSDGEGGSDTATLIITVNPLNTAPVTSGSIADQNDNDADSVSLNVSSFFSDVDGDTLSYSASGLPSGLSIDPLTGIISGTLDNSVSQGGSSGAYSITVTASDPDGASIDQTFTWNLSNPAPTAANDTGSADEDNAVIGNVLDNDSDPDGDDLGVTQFVVAGDPTTYSAGQNASVQGGTLQINSNGSYSFTPAANWNGTLPTVTYSLSDGEGGSDTATLIITVNPVNDAPSISAPDFIAAVEDINTALTGFSFSDVDAGAGEVVATLSVASGTLSASSGAGVVVSGSGDTLSLTGSIDDINAFIAAAQVSYTGAQDASGDVSLTLGLNDNGNTGAGGAQIASATSIIQIAPVADAPTVSVTLGPVVETTTTIDSSNAQSSGQGFTVSAFSVNGNPGTVSLNSSPLGFGVAGGASGNNVELGQNGAGSERLSVVFDTAIASATVRFAWLSTVERAEYRLFDSDGVQIGGAIVQGITDLIDPPITLTGTDGALISRIEFTAPIGVDNDYLINSISYVTSSSYPVTINVAPTDIDNSESISAVAVSIPAGATLSTGTFDPVEGTWSLPLVSDGSYTVAIDSTTHAVTISGLQMTTPSSVSGTPNLITTATVVDGSDTVDAIFGSAGNDLINASPDDDILSGGLGNDSLNGGAGADTFLWRAGDTGNDVIGDFNATEGDRIDLGDLLQGENQSNILDYLRVDLATSTLEISSTGDLGGAGPDVTITLENGGAPVDLSSFGATSSQIVNSLIAGADPLVKVDHS